MRFGALFLLLLAFAAPAWAQQDQPRTLAVGPNQSWQHAATGMILPSRSAGLTRGEIRDSTAEELDVVADYENRDEAVWATIYLYRTQVSDVPLWFDRALATIMSRSEYGLATQAAPVPTAFARPGASIASGFRVALDVGRPEIGSTAVALAPLGDGFLLKIRLSSSRLDGAALDALMSRFIEGLRWPIATGAERAAVPIQPCPAPPLRFRQARIVRGDPANVLMDLLGGVVVARNEGPPPVYCREPAGTADYGVYRPGGAADAYLVAVADAGIALSVGRAISIEGLSVGGGGRRYSMMMLDRDSTSALPSFNRLPPPAQAMAVAFGDRGPTISVSTNDPGGE